MPALTPHSIRTVGPVLMRSLFVWPDAAPGLPTRCEVVAISPLLRELISPPSTFRLTMSSIRAMAA